MRNLLGFKNMYRFVINIKYQNMKFTALAALGCVSASHKIDMFNPINFASRGTGHALVKQMLDQVSQVHDKRPNGATTFSQCDDDMSLFTLDTDATKSDPDPVTKGQSVNLEIHGIVSDSIEVKNVHIHCDWNGSTLYDEDNVQDNTYDADLAYALAWDVPSYAPGGDYDVTIKAFADDAKKNQK